LIQSKFIFKFLLLYNILRRFLAPSFPITLIKPLPYQQTNKTAAARIRIGSSPQTISKPVQRQPRQAAAVRQPPRSRWQTAAAQPEGRKAQALHPAAPNTINQQPRSQYNASSIVKATPLNFLKPQKIARSGWYGGNLSNRIPIKNFFL